MGGNPTVASTIARDLDSRSSGGRTVGFQFWEINMHWVKMRSIPLGACAITPTTAFKLNTMTIRKILLAKLLFPSPGIWDVNTVAALAAQATRERGPSRVF